MTRCLLTCARHLATGGLLAFGLLACGAEPASTGGGNGGGAAAGGGPPQLDLPTCVPDGAVEPPHMDIAGAVYSVPVPPALEPYASYPLEDVSLCNQPAGGPPGIELGYSLPALLVGKKQRVAFAGAYDAATDTYALSGDNGTATCHPTGAAWRCDEAFVGLVHDLEEVAKEAEDLDPAEAQARLEVAEIFRGDPIGILDFSLP